MEEKLPDIERLSKQTKSMLSSRINSFKPLSGNSIQHQKDENDLANFRDEYSERRRLYKHFQQRGDDFIEWLVARHEEYIIHPENSSLKNEKNNF